MKKILLSLATIGGVAALTFAVTGAFFSDTETSTGNLFQAGGIDLKIDSQCSYLGDASSQCGTWQMKDLVPTSDRFFNFTDVKPGDYGENTISIDVTSNDAKACLTIANMSDDDPNLTEPESTAGDTTTGTGQGELSPELHFFAWADDGDNLWETNEPSLFSNTEGPASDVLGGVSYNLGTIPAVGTQYLGVYWCYGLLGVDSTNHILSCDGSGVSNLSQTDVLSADLSFYVEQARNNPNFSCPPVD